MAEPPDISMIKSQLLYQFGLLLAPIENGIRAAEQGFSPSYSEARARYEYSLTGFYVQFNKFFLEAIPGHKFSAEFDRWVGVKVAFGRKLQRNDEFNTEVKGAVDDYKKTTFHVVSSIPNNLEDRIVGKHSPFSAFLIIRALLENARRRVLVIDPYVDDNIFYRYLSHISSDAEVILATEMKNLKGSSEIRFLDCSRLLAQERGVDKYTLISSQMHDRWLLVDDEIYHSGASLKDAARSDPFTLARIELTQAVRDEIDKVLSTGSVIFGPSCPNHP